MIINRVWAENVLKYASLELNDLPDQGLIGVDGANESGKSTIGETICFALFGRTFSYDESEIVNVIRWGEPSCAVSVDFSLNGQRYSASRFLDAQGNHGARLSDVNDVPLARGVEPVKVALEALVGFGFEEFIESFYLAQREITAPHPHSMAVKKMAGIAALEQVSADAKAEIRQEQNAISEAEDTIANIEQLVGELNLDASLLPTLESQRDELRVLQDIGAEEITKLQNKTKRYQELKGNVQAEVEIFGGIGIDTTYQGWQKHVDRFESHLDRLVQEHEDETTLTSILTELRDFARGAKQRLLGFGKLRDEAGSYRKHLANLLGDSTTPADGLQPIEPLGRKQSQLRDQLHHTRGKRTKVRIALYIFLLLAIVAWSVWGLLSQIPPRGITQNLSTWLAATLPGWEQIHQTWLLPIAGILSVLFALCGFRSLNLGSKIGRLQQSLDELGKQLAEARRQADIVDALDGMTLPQVTDALFGFENDELTAAVLMLQKGESADLIDASRLAHYHTQLDSLQERLGSNVTDQCQALETQIETIRDDLATRQEKIGQLSEQIVQEQARHQKFNELEDSIASQQEIIAACRHRIQVRELTRDILTGGAQHIAKTFNRDIRGLVGLTLPLLTQGRYEHLKIDENLEVQVFSGEKRDFMQLEEISTGTQRQIMLAVRLALSQEFINTTLGRPQFIFLDEPFAFFDEERARSALQALPQLSKELNQIWIVAQSFPQGFTFDLTVHCGRDKNVLVSPSETSPA